MINNLNKQFNILTANQRYSCDERTQIETVKIHPIKHRSSTETSRNAWESSVLDTTPRTNCQSSSSQAARTSQGTTHCVRRFAIFRSRCQSTPVCTVGRRTRVTHYWVSTPLYNDHDLTIPGNPTMRAFIADRVSTTRFELITHVMQRHE